MNDHFKQLYLHIIEKAAIADDNDFYTFALKRMQGAQSIADKAKAKGGPAMLTYHHFIVKIPYYRRAAEGKFNVKAAMKELKKLTAQLNKECCNVQQTTFQKLVGRIEVLGELIIKHS